MKSIRKYSQIQEGDYLLSIKGKAIAVAEAAYGIVALEMLRTEFGVEDAIDEVLDCVVKSGTFEEYVCDYLGHALEASGFGGGERIYDLDPDDVRAFFVRAMAGSVRLTFLCVPLG